MYVCMYVCIIHIMYICICFAYMYLVCTKVRNHICDGLRSSNQRKRKSRCAKPRIFLLHFYDSRTTQSDAAAAAAAAYSERELLGQSGIYSAAAIHNVSETSCSLGRHSEALAMRESVLEFNRRVLPEYHPDIGKRHVRIS
jgi:hypothetical protein